MSDFDDLRNEINRGMDGRNGGIPMGFNRLNKYIGIRKRIYTLLFGATGSGKSAFVHSAYVLNPFDYYYQNKDKVQLKIILASMERSKLYTQAKWLSRKIFIDHAVLIPIPKMLGWWDTKLTHDESDLIGMYEDYIGELMSVVDIVEGSQVPTKFYARVKAYALANGREEPIDERTKIYIPNKPDEIVIPIGDHFGLWKREEKMSFKKEAIDKGSEYFQWFRDYLGHSPIAISQMTRDKGNVLYQKMDSFEPTIDDVKESGRPAEDSDVVIALFDPVRYNTNDPDYDVNNFQDPNTGAKYFRKLKILKNTYGEDDISIGMGFMGSTGIFKELPKPSHMGGFDYNSLFDNSFFLQ